jgi:putative endonuclease
MYYVYVLNSKTKKYIYVGLTNNLKRRIHQHQTGREKTTRPYRPFEVLKVETFPDRIQARQREKYLKSGIGKEYLKKLL